MGCGCNKNKNAQNGNSSPDLNRYGYLSPRQLKILEAQKKKLEQENQDKAKDQ